MTIVRQLLENKGYGFISVSPEDSILSAIKKMADKDIGSVLVMRNGDLVGIFTERHYARNFPLKGRTSSEAVVEDIMETRVTCVGLTDSIETCMARMTRERIRHLPVVDGGRVVGIVSIGDLLKSMIDEQRTIIHELEGYIHDELHTH